MAEMQNYSTLSNNNAMMGHRAHSRWENVGRGFEKGFLENLARVLGLER